MDNFNAARTAFVLAGDLVIRKGGPVHGPLSRNHGSHAAVQTGVYPAKLLFARRLVTVDRMDMAVDQPWARVTILWPFSLL